MRNPFFMYLFFSIFALAGLGCGIAAVYMWYDRYQLKTNGEQTTGEVIDLAYSRSKNSTTIAPIIGFQTRSGEQIVYHSNYYTNIDPFKVGDRVALWYDKNDPQNVALEEGGSLFIWLPGIFFFTHGGVGFGGLFWMERKRRRFKWLQTHGKEVYARFVGVKSWGNSSNVLECAWTDPYTQQTYTFKSESVRSVPPHWNADAPIRVLIDPDNPKKYWVEA